ncbi:hypothetical protein CEXT_631371 [Caerostris extrusa]|uniref:Uncharacterized protein n=1 Tax=Caerostris extrusa TaxID=172846 RepID=A0AAV4YAB2_CAEEX|nr:hypothetical protein CEXT_631371 [Caerostris extrusa]
MSGHPRVRGKLITGDRKLSYKLIALVYGREQFGDQRRSGCPCWISAVMEGRMNAVSASGFRCGSGKDCCDFHFKYGFEKSGL